ncbi:MAG: hypothetical protein WAU89_04595 [Candidatus Acidiferrales bacterium]
MNTPLPGSEAQKLLDVEGKWVITFADPDNKNPTRILTLSLHNGKLTGTLDAPACPCEVSGKMKDDKLKLKITPHGARSMNYAATVTGNTMKGESYMEGIPHHGVKFTGIRQVQADPASVPQRTKFSRRQVSSVGR